MNSWGWLGCWSHRAEIISRIKREAAKEGLSTRAPALLYYGVKGLRGMVSLESSLMLHRLLLGLRGVRG
jgi:hypothetical protein